MYLQEAKLGGMDWNELARDTVMGGVGALVNAVMNLWVP
jgi:hypothetical protein